ncbi:MAG: hypothetical protein E7533_03385 [Ruminococcaceae bacterium]|nr:hypothetical protein [Oscillospiraceae bacterium]
MDAIKTGKYPQKIVERIELDGKISSVAVTENGDIYACSESGFFRYRNGGWHKLFADGVFTRVFCDKKGRVFASIGKTLYAIEETGARRIREFDYEIADLAGEEALYVLTRRSLYVEQGEDFYNLQEMGMDERSLAVFGDKVCVASELCLQRMEGKRRTWRCIFPAHSTMPELHINVISFDKTGYLLVGADEGLFIYDYKSGWYSHKEMPALPQESVFAITVCEDGSFLLGTDAGAVHIKNGIAKYLPATRYAFDTSVTAVAEKGGALYTASEGGVVKISEKLMTLEEKSKILFETTEKYFPRKHGYVTWVKSLDGNDCSHPTDNDGLWTHSYLAGLAMWYAVTKDEEVLKAARRTKDAMLFLTRAPEIKGFTARAVRFPDEENWGTDIESTEIGREWHRSSDGSYEWLGETSSDEMSGHYAGFSLYYDLCADEAEKKEICEAVCNITDHILDNDGYLIDKDGKPTSWACWNEEALNTDSMWMWEKGVNSLEMLNFLKISYHMSGNERYNEKYMSLIKDHHFLINAAYHKRADGHSCHIDDNLAMLNTLSYLRLENDPAIRQYLLMGLASHYEYEKIEGNPYFAFVYKGFTGAPCDVDGCVKALKDYPCDLKNYKMINSNRRNIEMDNEPLKWYEEPHIKTPFAWDERPFSTLGLRPFKIDGGNGMSYENGMSFIFIYWLGRFFGIIE